MNNIDPATLAALQQNGQPGPGSEEKEREEAEKRSAQETMKRDMLATVLDPAARERLSRIALVSPSRSAQIEGILLRMAQSGQLKGRVSEEQLIGLLEQADGVQGKASAKKKGGIVYQRRKDFDDDDDWDDI